MSDQQDNEQMSHLREVNAELRQSLKRCRSLLDDCRSKLAANSNEPQSANDEEDEDRASAD
jgi:hypothetical protein